MMLRDRYREMLLQIFARQPISLEVWAYGSRVNGTSHLGSDLDLVVKAKDGQPIPTPIMANLRAQIHDSNVPILVELRDWAKVPPSFQDQINKAKELFFDSPG